MNVETKLNVPIITSETTKFPAGGASVKVGEGVTVITGLSHGDISGRGIRVVVDGKSYPTLDPDGGIVKDDTCVSTPAVNSVRFGNSHFSV